MLCLLAALFAWGCSESLEDTYDEYIEGGMIRYLGKCSDVQVNPGWERLQVVWKNNVDAGIKRVKITWQSENEKTPFVRYIDRTEAVDETNLMDTTYLEDLVDATYTIRVSNVAADSTESLVEEKYGRPYTYDHEDLRTFTRGISAFSRMGEKLAVVLDQDNANVEELQLCYYEVGKQEETVWDIKEHMTDTLYYDWYGPTLLCRDYIFLLPEEPDAQIDFNRPLTLKRKGKLTGCIDPIDFQDETLNLNERVWSTEFSQLMLAQEGPDWESRLNDIHELEFDYDIVSMQDLMYFPALEKVVLGKNRYMDSYYVWDYSSVTDQYVGLVMLSLLKELNPNFVVERYNQHYFGYDDWGYLYIDALKGAGKIDQDFNIIEMADANLQNKPTYTPLDTTGWEITCSDTLKNGYATNGAAMLLFDGPRIVEDIYWGPTEQEVYFEPNATSGASIVTVTFDMDPENTGDLKTVVGFKVGQPTRAQEGDINYLLSSLMVEFSADSYTWTDASYNDGSLTIGATPGEETFIEVPKDLQTPARYIRITMSNRATGNFVLGEDGSQQGTYSLRLGKFIPLEELNIP